MNRQKVEWWVRAVLYGHAAAFAVVGAIFVLAPNGTVRFINACGSAFGFREAPTSDLKFWLSLGFSYMVLVTLLAYLSARDIYANRKLLPLLAAGKAASSLSCLVFFIASAPYFIYLLNFLVDGSIVFVALGCYAVIGWLDESRGAGNGGAPLPPVGSRDRRVMCVMLDHLFPAGGRIPEGASDVALDEKLWRFAAEQGAPLVLAFRALMRFWEHAAPVLCGRFASLSSLSESEREHVIERIAASRISLLRQTVFQLKFLGGLHFYGEPRVAAALGYVPPKVAK